MMSEENRTQPRETYSPQHKVLTNNDLLTQILIRLPILCIHLFATVSKEWLRIITSPLFIKNRSQITKLDPHVVLFVNHIKSLFESDFVLLDPRIQSKKSDMDRSFTLGSTEEADNVKILQSCNGLLLCGGSGMTVFDYVVGLRIAFDPTKSPHYKLVDVGRTSCDIENKDSFLVIKLSGKVVQYNLISKTLHEIYDCGSNQLDDNDDDNDDDDDELLQQFQAEHNVIPSFASV
ncbi:hypothetical protein Tco_1456963 [Tanacetum coccineum]